VYCNVTLVLHGICQLQLQLFAADRLTYVVPLESVIVRFQLEVCTSPTFVMLANFQVNPG